MTRIANAPRSIHIARVAKRVGKARINAAILASRSYIIGAMLNLELSDDEADALRRELIGITGSSRFPPSPRIQALAAILAKLEPPPPRPEARPPLKACDAPKVRRRQRE